jgi:hypothetical protein
MCTTGQQNELYRIGDMSLHGVRLIGERVLPPEAEVRAEVWWPGVGSCRVRGRVVRSVPETGEFALEFTETDGKLSELVSALTQIGTMRGSSASTLVYIEDQTIAERVMKQLAKHGKRAMAATTPLQAIALLSDPWAPISAVIFDSSARGLEMARYLRDEEPTIRRMFVPVGGSIYEGRDAVANGLAQDIRSVGLEP